MVLHHEFRVAKSGHKIQKAIIGTPLGPTKPITGHVGWQGNTYTSLYNQQEVLFHALFVEALPGLRVAPFPEAVKTKILFGRVFQPKPEPSFTTGILESQGPQLMYMYLRSTSYIIYIYCIYYTLYIELMMAELMEMARHPSSIGGTVCFLSTEKLGERRSPGSPSTHSQSRYIFLYHVLLHICYIHLLKLRTFFEGDV